MGGRKSNALPACVRGGLFGLLREAEKSPVIESDTRQESWPDVSKVTVAADGAGIHGPKLINCYYVSNKYFNFFGTQ
jgi:hypothetical protein